MVFLWIIGCEHIKRIRSGKFREISVWKFLYPLLHFHVPGKAMHEVELSEKDLFIDYCALG
jgi:hypothetical protein